MVDTFIKLKFFIQSKIKYRDLAFAGFSGTDIHVVIFYLISDPLVTNYLWMLEAFKSILIVFKKMYETDLRLKMYAEVKGF